MAIYSIKVSRFTYIWGGQQVDVELNSSLFLTFRVGDTGEPITFGITKVNPKRNINLGLLNIGETFTIPLNGICGIFAECQFDTNIECFIESTPNDGIKPSLFGVGGL